MTITWLKRHLIRKDLPRPQYLALLRLVGTGRFRRTFTHCPLTMMSLWKQRQL
jgi:hypothetical protein